MHLGQDALALGIGVDGRRATAVTGFEGGKSLPIEARDQTRDGFPGTATGGFGRVGVALSVGDGKQGFGTSDMRGGLSLGASHPHQPVAFVVGEWPERILLAAGHRKASWESLLKGLQGLQHTPLLPK